MVGQLVIGNAAATTLLSGGSLVPAFVADIAVNPGNYENPAEVTHFGSIFPVRGIGPVTMDLAGPVSYVAAASVPLLCRFCAASAPLPAGPPLALAGRGMLGFVARRRG
jgi:hypothetical protein